MESFGPELLVADRSVLVVIDLQGKLMDAIHRPALVKEAIRRLLVMADLFRVPVLLTEQYPQGLGATCAEVASGFEQVTSPKRRLEKTSFGCCGDAGFCAALAELRPAGGAPRQVVVAGIEAHVCVMQTVIELLRAGDRVYVCWDAVSGRGEEHRGHALDRMQQAGAVITNHESVGFEWARDKNHAKFKAMAALFKAGQPR